MSELIKAGISPEVIDLLIVQLNSIINVPFLSEKQEELIIRFLIDFLVQKIHKD